MTIYQILCLLGIPGIVSAVWALAIHQGQSVKALKLGVQAMLRDRLLSVYRQCHEKGYATDEERQNFLNMYTQYHTLGANGVMDDYKNKLLSLPIEEVK